MEKTMRGPKPYKIPDMEKINQALARGLKHGPTLYTKGCRCEICRESRRKSAAVYRRLND